MAATTGSEVRSGIGARLKAGRERMGMTLLQVAEKLHVDAKVLESLEGDRFEELGAPVYAKGHIKRYSELVSENTAQLLDIYAAATKPVLPDLTQLPKAAHHADPRKLVLPSLVVLIAFVLIGTVWWILQNFDSQPVRPQTIAEDADNGGSVTESFETSAPDVAPAAGTSPANTSSTPAATKTPTPAPAPVVAPTPAPRASSPPLSSTPSVTQPTAPTASKLRGSGTAAGTTAGADSTARITKTTRLAANAPPDVPRVKQVKVTLRFSADSWAEVYDADGQRLFYDIGSAKSSRNLSGTPPLRVVLGNASGVSLSINGRRSPVPANAVQNDGAQFTINRSGRIVRAQSDGAAAAESKPGD